MDSHVSTHVLGYTEFGAWYDRHRADVLDPALRQALAALEALVSDELSDRDMTRIRLTSGRVKSKPRTWRKVHQTRYQGKIATPQDIPGVIDDLVGLRITCVNLRDIEMVQAALDSLPRSHVRNGLWMDPRSERDYVAEPKESGYRGWHVNLGTILDVGGQRTPVTCELQVRTLLEDSWGELTHEDTYSKDGTLPPLVAVLSRRMADLLSTLDDIAEDLRTELDRIDALVVADPQDDPASIGGSDTPSEQGADAAAMLLERWRSLENPVDLASLAWGLQREFGAEISDDWFGQRSFKRFLLHAIPEGEISSGDQAYLLPAGSGVDGDEIADHPVADHDNGQDGNPPGPPPVGDSTIPDAARQLRRVERGFPLLESDELANLYAQLGEAWTRLGGRAPSMRVVNQITRAARDQAAAGGTSLSRRHLDYVAKAVLSAAERTNALDAAGIARAFSAATLDRMIELRIIDPKRPKQRNAVERWLQG